MASAISLLPHLTRANSSLQPSSPLSVSRSPTLPFTFTITTQLYMLKLSQNYGHRNLIPALNSSSGGDVVLPALDNEDGVSLGTMKLPMDTDLQRFEILLFQWANSLCQGANLPLPVPLKVDKISGGARLGFITIEDGKTEVLVYIDCLVFPANGGSNPIFRAIRNGPANNKPAPGEPRIMRSLLPALQKSVEIARV